MSIGFAVDLSAHIVYAFVTASGDVRSRVVGALEHLGWPIFQVNKVFEINQLFYVFRALHQQSVVLVCFTPSTPTLF